MIKVYILIKYRKKSLNSAGKAWKTTFKKALLR